MVRMFGTDIRGKHNDITNVWVQTTWRKCWRERYVLIVESVMLAWQWQYKSVMTSVNNNKFIHKKGSRWSSCIFVLTRTISLACFSRNYPTGRELSALLRRSGINRLRANETMETYHGLRKIIQRKKPLFQSLHLLITVFSISIFWGEKTTAYWKKVIVGRKTTACLACNVVYYIPYR